MTQEKRYELKLVFDETQLQDFKSWLVARTNAKMQFQQRKINSVYFDDLNYSSIRDNLAGLLIEKNTP